MQFFPIPGVCGKNDHGRSGRVDESPLTPFLNHDRTALLVYYGRNADSSGENISWGGLVNDIVRSGRVADFSQHPLFHKVGVWIALGVCALADVAVVLPLILGMDVHFGALGFIT